MHGGAGIRIGGGARVLGQGRVCGGTFTRQGGRVSDPGGGGGVLVGGRWGAARCWCRGQAGAQLEAVEGTGRGTCGVTSAVAGTGPAYAALSQPSTPRLLPQGTAALRGVPRLLPGLLAQRASLWAEAAHICPVCQGRG